MKLDKKKIHVAIGLVVLVFVFIALASYSPKTNGIVTNSTFEKSSDLFFDYEISRFPSDTEVSGNLPSGENLEIGVVVDPWNLNFGKIPEGDNYGTRYIVLKNVMGTPAKIIITPKGNITPYVNFSKNNFFLGPLENQTVSAHFYVTGAKTGNYTGEIDIIVQRPKYDFVDYFWR